MAEYQDDFSLDDDGLYFIPYGGSEQFGVNFNLYAYQRQWLAVDLGMGFADHRFPGIDLIFPDPSFLAARRSDLAGLIITHAHEDHIGAVPYLWPRLRCPVYCSPFTAEVLRRKLGEARDSRGMKIVEVHPGDPVSIGPFTVHFVPVAHSIPESASVIIETDEGRVVHSADWNLDPAPVIGKPTDSKVFKAWGEKGVLAYVGDSTNAAVKGRAGSEADVEKGLEAVFSRCKGRIAVTTFSSNIGRIQSICRAAEACERSVAVMGRSMNNMVGAARECGYLNDLQDLVSEEEIDTLPADRQVLILTGSQGEARAALSRIAHGERSSMKLGRGDTVIFSARAIPGNEKDIDNVKNALVAGGVEVISPGDVEETIHVSGHPYRDEIADMYSWVRPETVIPVHGERLQLEAQADLARKCQIKNVIVPSNGSVIRLAKGQAEVIDHIDTDVLVLDGQRLMPADHASIRARRKLQYTGAIHASVVLDGRGDVAADPQVTTLGLIDRDDPEEKQLEEDMLGEIEDILADMEPADRRDDHAVHEEVRIGLRRMANLLLRIRPKVTIHVTRV